MIALQQNDPRWRNIQLGSCPGETIGRSGCLITCYAMLSGKTPPEVNSILTQKNGYQMGCLVYQSRACELLDLTNGGTTKLPQVTPCIAETNHFAPKVPQHFFIWLGDGTILDPLDGKKKTNPYKIVSYRNITTKKNETEVPMPSIDIPLEQFRAAFITVVGRWPDDTEVNEWRGSGKPPWQFIQETKLAHVLSVERSKVDETYQQTVKDLQQEVATLSEEINLLKSPAPQVDEGTTFKLFGLTITIR